VNISHNLKRNKLLISINFTKETNITVKSKSRIKIQKINQTMTRPSQTDKNLQTLCATFSQLHSLLRKSTLISSYNLFMHSLSYQIATWILTFVGENHPSFDSGLTMI